MSKADHSDAECWKCGQKGHIHVNCHSKKKKKDGKDGNMGKGKYNTNIATGGVEFAFTMMFTGATLARNNNPLSHMEVDVYNSGASAHMSPSQSRFISLQSITPRPIKAADHTLFVATAVSELHILIPNGKTTRDVTLKQALFCPDLAFTLVLLTKCDIAGYTALLKDCKCTISDPHGTVLGQVPLTGGLYKHKYAPKVPEAANVMQKIPTLNQLHWQMGHISPHAVKTLVKTGAVTSLVLDMHSEASFCDACVKAKPTCVPILKEHTGP